MISVEFKNEIGTFVMGGAEFFGLRIYKITGLGFNAPTRETEVYNGVYGARTLSRHIPERTITISGEINSDCLNRLKIKQEIVRIIRLPGVLTVTGNGKRRCIKAEANECDFGDRNALIQKFTLQFVCEESVFYTPEVITQNIAMTIPHIKGEFKLPMVFSTRVDRLAINNTGDLPIEPTIMIYDAGERIFENSSDSIVIRNNNSGAFINLTRTTSDGEVICVDIAQRQITSTLTDTDLYCFSDDTVLSDFVIHTGISELEVINYTNRNIRCDLQFRELFTECEVV